MLGAEADGFRDIKWGDAPRKNMTFWSHDSTRNIKTYTINNDKMSVGEASITSIYYWYFDNKFMGVYLQNYGLGDFNSLKATLEAKFGSSYKSNKSTQYLDYYMWSGGNTEITMKYNNYSGEGEIIIMNNSFSKESEQYKKNLAAKAVKDL